MAQDIRQLAFGPTPYEQLPPEAQALRAGRTLNIPNAGSAAAIIEGRTQQSGSPSSSFAMALQGLLQRYQQMGTRPAVEQGLNAQSQQIGRIQQTPNNLIGAAPGVQAGVRSASAGAVSPTIQGANTAQQTFREQLSGFGSALEAAQAFATKQEQSERQKQEDARAVVEFALGQGGSSGLESLIASNPEILKTAGMDSKTLTALLPSIKAREAQERAQFNTRYGSSGTGTADPFAGLGGTPTTPQAPVSSDAVSGETFEEYLDRKQNEVGQTFGQPKRDQLRKEWEKIQGSSSSSGGANLNTNQLISAVNNLRFGSVEESKRIRGNVAARIKAGDLKGAEDEIRSFGYQKLNATQQSDYALYDGAISSFQSSLAQLDDQSLTAGPYKALLEGAKPWAKIQRDKKYVDLRGTIELGQAQLRKGFYGTAVTGPEAANAKNFLIVDSDDINTIKWKLENAANFLQFTNDATVARAVNLPKPDINTYISTKKNTIRVKLKKTGQTGTIPASEFDSKLYEKI